MKNLFLTIFLLTMLILPKTFAETYTPELQDAYSYAYTIGITTQQTIQSANMYGSLIRAHMAKMMVNYTKNVLGKEPNTSLACNFSDIAGETKEMQGYIKTACQLGLMGVGITKFSPGDAVNRAQFGTVLSRALYGDLYNDGSPYYLFHLQALQQDSIMKDISKPEASELRGYVMLMMMRAGGKVEQTTSQCESGQIQLLCLVGSYDCPSECQLTDDVTTKAGTLNITVDTSSAGTISAGSRYAGAISVSSDQDIRIASLVFQKVGTFTKGWIEEDGVQIATFLSSPIDTTTTAIFSPSLVITQGESKVLRIFIEGNSASGQGVSLSSKSNITSSASMIEGKFPMKIVE